MKEIHGQLKADGRRFALVISRFNEFITRHLVDGAEDALRRHGGRE
ncbi:MAG: 6,7-dimethyl-8-ribityllumazine synthase, partial [Phycisphaerae bacterium]